MLKNTLNMNIEVRTSYPKKNIFLYIFIYDDDDGDDGDDDDHHHHHHPKVHFIWVPEVGISRGHEPIIDQSCGAVIFFPLVELIEIYPPVTFPEPYSRSETQLCPKYWPT